MVESEKESNKGESSKSKKKKRKRKKKDKESSESDDDSSKKKSKRKHKKKKKKKRPKKVKDDDDGSLLEVKEPAKSPPRTKYEYLPALPRRKREPGLMTQLNDILIDGADDVAVEVPSQLKKAVVNVEEPVVQTPVEPVPELKPEEKKAEALAEREADDIIARKKVAEQVQSVIELMLGVFVNCLIF